MSEIKTDYLKVDPPISGQNWVCLSFVSPNDMIEKKNIYCLNKFLHHEVNQTIADMAVQMTKDINLQLRKVFEKRLEKLENSKNAEDAHILEHLKKIQTDFQIDENSFMNRCLRQWKIDEDEITDKYKIYQVQNMTELDQKFGQLNNNACSVRGVKVRGVFDRKKDADEHSKTLTKQVEPAHNVFVAPMGYWLPWDPNPDAIQDSEYMIPALNDLMGKYQDNVHSRNQFFEERTQEMVNEANMSTKDAQRARLKEKLKMRREQQMKEEMLKSLENQGQNDPEKKKKKKKKSKSKKSDQKEVTEDQKEVAEDQKSS